MKDLQLSERIRATITAGGLGCLERILRDPFADEDPERRSEPRFAVTRDVTVRTWLPPDFGLVRGQIRDISRSGVGMVVEDLIQHRAQIEFHLGDFQVFAEIKNIRPLGKDKGYFVGARIREVIWPDGRSQSHLGA